MRIAEIYGVSVSRGRTRDIVGAVAMSGHAEPLGAWLYRAVAGGDRSAEREAARVLAGMLRRRASREGWRQNDIARIGILSRRATTWWCDRLCRACYGRRYQKVPGAPSLSDHVCGACGGSGMRNAADGIPAALRAHLPTALALLDGSWVALERAAAKRMR